MDSAAADTPRQFISALENKFSQLTVSPDDASLPVPAAEPLPVYTPSEAPTPPAMPKAQASEPRGRSPGPRSLAARGLLRHRAGSSRNGAKPKTKSGQQPQTAALVVQLKRRLRSHQQQQGSGDSDEMEMDVDERRGRAGRRSNVRAGVLVARKRREGQDVEGGGAEDGDVSGVDGGVGSSRAGATPYERNNSALVCWSRRRASSFGERPRWASLPEVSLMCGGREVTLTSAILSTLPPPNMSPATRRKRSGRSASTSGLPLPLLDTTDLTVRRPSFAMSLMTPLVPDIDMASPMAITPVMRTSTESSMWAPRKLGLGVIHGPIEDTDTDVDAEPSTAEPTSGTPASPPPPYDSVIRPRPAQTEDTDGDADDEQTPLRTAPTAPLITVRDASPVPGSGTGASKGSSSLATVAEEEEDVDGHGEPADRELDVDANGDSKSGSKVQARAGVALDADNDQDAMVL
ncbi:hypothetical protein FRC10_001182 [Ceratobasidium sp. 414]|nr:hypothetical protein FRC10_001182 [Ceratobasidium sp. 414]